MQTPMPRRSFLKTAPVAAWAAANVAEGLAHAQDAPASAPPKLAIEAFNYEGVRLLPSRWLKQYEAARDFWLALPEDDILHGYRQAAGLAAPGKPLGGWCARNSDTVFGQWLSGLSRLAKATGDAAIRDKAVRLFTEWAKTIGPDGNCRMRHYPFDKLVCGLVDLHLYADCQPAGPMLDLALDWAAKTLSRENQPATIKDPSGNPHEWYTLSENLYRAYQITGNPRHKAFADAWLYHAYWDRFIDTANPAEAYGYHAYSHVNTFSSAAMAYAVTGDDRYLRVIRNAYDWLQNTQCYCTGGFGPPRPSSPAKAAWARCSTSAPTPLKPAAVPGRLQTHPLPPPIHRRGALRRLGRTYSLCNGISAALPVTSDGKAFYLFRLPRRRGGMKVCIIGTRGRAAPEPTLQAARRTTPIL